MAWAQYHATVYIAVNHFLGKPWTSLPSEFYLMNLLCVMGKRRDPASQRASWLVLTNARMSMLYRIMPRGIPIPAN
jgi:hypothetical protein